MNIIHIISDTFRRDNLSLFGGKGHAPFLNSFAEKCVVFDRTYVTSFPTVPIRGDLVTGQVGICRRGWEPLKRDVPVIADALTDAGVISMMIADTPHHLKEGFFYNRGFTGWQWIRGQETDLLRTQPFNYEDPEIQRYRTHTRTHPNQLPAGLEHHLKNTAFHQREEDTFVSKTMRTACQWLEQNYTHENFYLIVDTFDPHEPWDPPDWYVRRFDPDDYDGPEPIYPTYGPNQMDERTTKRTNALYRAEACLVDTWIGHLLTRIENMGLLENTMIIFMADHGFLLGEHGLIAKNLDMYEEVAHIPFMIYHPDAQPRRTSALTGILDVPATVLDVLDAKRGEQVEGNSLLPIVLGQSDTNREVAITHGAWVGGWSPDGGRPHGQVTDGEWSLLLENADPPNKLFYLPSDPEQNNNRFESDTAEAHRLYQAFLDFLEAHGGPPQMVSNFRQRFEP
ncbi:MAG: sulfatase [bacterium]|nr:sulfatase [bacterium]